MKPLASIMTESVTIMRDADSIILHQVLIILLSDSIMKPLASIMTERVTIMRVEDSIILLKVSITSAGVSIPLHEI